MRKRPIITNNFNMPEVLYRAIVKGYYDLPDDYDGYSVTQLINPPYQQKLKDEFGGEEDSSDGLWSLLGSAVHSVIEKANVPGYIQEQRLEIIVGGKKISGKWDIYDVYNKGLADIKVTSKYATKYGKPKDEWVKQLNMLAYIARQHGLEVNYLRIYAVLRDFLKTDTYKHEFPEKPFMTLEVPLMTNDAILAYMEARVALFEKYDSSSIPFLEVCSPEERWNMTTYKFYKSTTADRAINNATFYNEQDAASFKRANPTADLRIVSNDKRCKDWCSVKQHCIFGRDL